jgi:putative glutamine amidotransferase
MKWLLTHTTGSDKVRNYLRWLERHSILGDLRAPDDGVPSDLGEYDALLLTGGGDVDPGLYGEPPHSCADGIDRARDRFESDLIEAFLGMGKAVFSLCRGLQILNVHLGGKLIQHLPEYMDRPEEHRQIAGKDSFHSLRFVCDSALSRALNGVDRVNSSHHQAIDPAAVGRNLRVLARSGAGVIEAVEGVGLPSPVLAVQWHPERLAGDDPASAELLRLMLRMAQGRGPTC